MRNSISSIERTTTVASVVEKLRRKIILNGYIKGISLTEVELATSYGVSRGSIRSALQVLEGEGLVETLPNGRKIVIGLSEKDIHDLYRVRAILESEAVKTILECPYLNYAPLANDVHEFEELLKEDDEDALIKKRIRINIRFHRTLMEMCGNRSLIRCWIQQQSLAETLAEINSEVLQVKSHHEEYIQKHQEILRLLILKSPTAVDYIKEHLESFGDMTWDEVQDEMKRLMEEYPDTYTTEDTAVRRAVINLSGGKLTSEDLNKYKDK